MRNLATQIKLLSQYNRRQTPIEWTDFFGVLSKKDDYHVAISYTPDSYLQTLENEKFIQISSNRRIGSYDFDDSSFVCLVQALSKFTFHVRDITWTSVAEEHLADLLDLDDPETALDFDMTMEIVQKNLSAELQGIQALTLVDDSRERIEVTRYGVVNVRSTISPNIQNVIKRALL